MPYVAVNGLKMYYEIHGEGPALVLLHGGTGAIPSRWIPYFTPPFRVIAPEFMGHGRTRDLANRPFHYRDLAKDTVELMQALDIERAAVVGYSDGGIVGLEMAMRSPMRVSRLVVTGANARFDGYTTANQDWIRTLDPASEPVSSVYAELSPDGPEHWPVFLARMKAMWATEPDFTDEELRTIQAPTLVIIGDRDIVTPEHAVELFRAIPRAQLCVVPNAGHGVMPAQTVLAFLAEEADA
jgi:pimeloyl-ACP methyl ester carboxylesterase